MRFPYNKEAVKILVEQTNNSVNGGVSEAKMQLSENALLVLNIIKHDGTLTQKQIVEQSKLSVRSVQRTIKELRDNEIIAREGFDKSGTYIFLPQ